MKSMAAIAFTAAWLLPIVMIIGCDNRHSNNSVYAYGGPTRREEREPDPRPYVVKVAAKMHIPEGARRVRHIFRNRRPVWAMDETNERFLIRGEYVEEGRKFVREFDISKRFFNAISDGDRVLWWGDNTRGQSLQAGDMVVECEDDDGDLGIDLSEIHPKAERPVARDCDGEIVE